MSKPYEKFKNCDYIHEQQRTRTKQNKTTLQEEFGFVKIQYSLKVSLHILSMQVVRNVEESIEEFQKTRKSVRETLSIIEPY